MSTVYYPSPPEPVQGATMVHGAGKSMSGVGPTTTDAVPLSPAPRPNLVRRDTDQILSYYQSEHAGRSLDYASDAPDPNSPQPASGPGPGPDLLLPSSTTMSPAVPFPPLHTRQNSTFSSASDYSSHYSGSEDSASSPRLGPAPAPAFTAPSPSASGSHVQGSTSHSSTGASPPPTSQGDRVAARSSRRISTPSEGGADRRRLAIVEMDTHTTVPPLSVRRIRSKGFESDGKSSVNDSASPNSMVSVGTLFSRRGLHIGGLALVAPPDASPKTYTDLTPPSTAPVSTGSAAHPPPSAFPTHARSASEAVDSTGGRSRLRHKSSRDVGIVGLTLSPTASAASTASESLGPISPTSDDYHGYVHVAGLGVPLFQTPARSRSPSPGGTTPELSDTSVSSAGVKVRSPHQRLLSTPIFGMEDGAITPGIGEGKDISQPVVGPVIVGLSPRLLHGHGAQGMTSTNVPAAARASSPTAQSPTSPSYSGASSSSSPLPYLHYHAGVHATAGPLPPPPRSIFDRDSNSNINSNLNAGTTGPPPRPPRYHTPLPSNARRDIDAIKEALQLPQSVSAKLAVRTAPASEERVDRDASPVHLESSRNKTRSQESVYSQESSEQSIKLVPSKSVHRREGAFPPSKIMSSPPGKTLTQTSLSTGEQLPTSPRSEVHPSVVIEQDEPEEVRKEEGRRGGFELRRESSWVSLSQEVVNPHSSPNGMAGNLPAVSVSRTPSSTSAASSSSSVSQLPSLPPKSIRHGSDDEKPNSSLAPSAFKALTTLNLKRFSSLPRTPSHSSKSSKRSSSPDPRRSFSPPLPPPQVFVQSPPRRRIVPKPKYVDPWPPAMNVGDIVVLRSSRERARMYAMKINALSTYDCGLRDWMASTQGRGPVSHPHSHSQRTTQQDTHPVPAEFGGMSPKLRHVSHSSMASEMTFPIRADAYTATDLSARPIDVAPSTAPPAILPYPSLAQAQLQRPAARSSTLLLSPTKSIGIPLPLPSTKSSGAGFFASLGRKTSLRKEKGSLLTPRPQSPTKVLTKQQQRPGAIAQSHSNPPPQLGVPHLRGGPRAAPGRIQRAKTYSVGLSAPPPPEQQNLLPQPRSSPSPPRPDKAQSPNGSQRQSTGALRRPSLFARARPGHSSVVPTSNRPTNVAVDPAFERQVEKLADLLPHADRTILAGYLRRAGEDILAIGQYLEDEKNGTLRRD